MRSPAKEDKKRSWHAGWTAPWAARRAPYADAQQSKAIQFRQPATKPVAVRGRYRLQFDIAAQVPNVRRDTSLGLAIGIGGQLQAVGCLVSNIRRRQVRVRQWLRVRVSEQGLVPAAQKLHVAALQRPLRCRTGHAGERTRLKSAPGAIAVRSKTLAFA
ncbi:MULTISPECIES: hypothetical protein [Xanthomonas]|uniref:Uncharacterized protein n=1 Tax=Xanthomonas dyei TaxID=743699 RepID=A0ABZ0DBL6_9XANT|nr:hypothetical protein [Xanthomonas dyei]WOB27675.1 hypothetical protein NYR99_07030 [Xanthomonas dyei]WOB55297.1 hypothetical protein NYR95_07035 [Xanthomonas dyei]